MDRESLLSTLEAQFESNNQMEVLIQRLGNISHDGTSRWD